MYKVLIVEDDPMVAMINEQYIRRNKNFTLVGKCGDGMSALGLLEKTDIDLMILDVYMPKMNGFETLREIRNRQITTDVIMVTAANDIDSLEEALHLGVVDYLVKPFTFDRFQMALEKYIAKINALKDIEKLNQSNIDSIIVNSRKNTQDLFPKGIQEKTMQCIMDYLRENSGVWFTGDQIAGEIGLTGVTVRRYMNYLSESGRVIGEMNYETGGRPCMLYKVE
ncbi:MAG: response regulator [Acutalibacteraceae bacterium]|nr:response regulator [Acutalibacteraceae bacterium]